MAKGKSKGMQSLAERENWISQQRLEEEGKRCEEDERERLSQLIEEETRESERTRVRKMLRLDELNRLATMSIRNI